MKVSIVGWVAVLTTFEVPSTMKSHSQGKEQPNFTPWALLRSLLKMIPWGLAIVLNQTLNPRVDAQPYGLSPYPSPIEPWPQQLFFKLVLLTGTGTSMQVSEHKWICAAHPSMNVLPHRVFTFQWRSIPCCLVSSRQILSQKPLLWVMVLARASSPPGDQTPRALWNKILSFCKSITHARSCTCSIGNICRSFFLDRWKMLFSSSWREWRSVVQGTSTSTCTEVLKGKVSELFLGSSSWGQGCFRPLTWGFCREVPLPIPPLQSTWQSCSPEPGRQLWNNEWENSMFRNIHGWSKPKTNTRRTIIK